MRIKIEKNVPLAGKAKYYDAILKMDGPVNGQPRDSFTFPQADFGNVRNFIMIIRKLHPKRKFKTMRISETERRIWRTR